MKGSPRSLGRAPVGTEMFLKRFRYPIVNRTVTVTAAGAADAFGVLAVGALPQGNVVVVPGVAYLTVTTADADAGATWSGQAAFGTTQSADVTFSGTDADLVPATAIGPAVARTVTGAAGRVGATSSAAATPVFTLDNTAGTSNVNLNIKINNADFADAAAADLTVNGYVDLFLAVIGDD